MLTARQCMERLHEAGFSDTQIADRTGMAFMTVYQIRTAEDYRPRKETRDKLFDAMVEMLAEKKRQAEREAEALATLQESAK